jgi:DNA-binding Lrp family transcriptional regulator
MPIAFLFVVTELGFEEDVLREIRTLPDVKEAHLIYGMYDIMVKIEGSTANKVEELVKKIRKLDKIRSTQTLIAP